MYTELTDMRSEIERVRYDFADLSAKTLKIVDLIENNFDDEGEDFDEGDEDYDEGEDVEEDYDEDGDVEEDYDEGDDEGDEEYDADGEEYDADGEERDSEAEQEKQSRKTKGKGASVLQTGGAHAEGAEGPEGVGGTEGTEGTGGPGSIEACDTVSDYSDRNKVDWIPKSTFEKFLADSTQFIGHASANPIVISTISHIEECEDDTPSFPSPLKIIDEAALCVNLFESGAKLFEEKNSVSTIDDSAIKFIDDTNTIEPCMKIFKAGKNKGEQCSKMAMKGGEYCKLHQIKTN
ncbi:MAG: hypothetical protein EHM20_11455 [Alphaproteobacteria bacterium]|nr:MAG: hypothetical protein EHM20_11455 [Alphaproteobacteria bacterium]